MTKHNSNTELSKSVQFNPDGQVRPDERESSAATDRRSNSDRRRSVLDRRTGLDRRRKRLSVPVDHRQDLERRRGPGIRREEDRRAAEEGEMTDEQFEFVMAVDTYKRANNRPFPTLTEILEVVQALGYRKID